MTDLDDFMNMKDVPKSRRYLWSGPKEPVIYVCTICGKVAPPTCQLNLRCEKCKAPLIGSVESVIKIQRQIKGCDGDQQRITELREKIQWLRQIKKEHAALKNQMKKVEKEEQRRKRRPIPKGEEHEVLIFNVIIPRSAHPPNGFQGNIKIRSDQLADFEKKCEKTKTQAKLVASQKEWDAMDQIRRSMIEVSK
jgi:hypothetical protein